MKFNQLYNQYNKQNPTAETFMNMFGGSEGFNNAMSQAAQFVRQQNMTPEQLGRSLISSGRLSQADFDKFRTIANAITGMNY